MFWFCHWAVMWMPRCCAASCASGAHSEVSNHIREVALGHTWAFPPIRESLCKWPALYAASSDLAHFLSYHGSALARLYNPQAPQHLQWRDLAADNWKCAGLRWWWHTWWRQRDDIQNWHGALAAEGVARVWRKPESCHMPSRADSPVYRFKCTQGVLDCYW